MDSTALNLVKVANQDEFGWPYLEEQPLGTLEYHSGNWDWIDQYLGMSSFYECDPCFLQQQNNHIPYFDQLKDFEDISGTFGICDTSYNENRVFDAKPINSNMMIVGLSHSDNVTSHSTAIMQQENLGSQISSYTEWEEGRRLNGGSNSKSAALELGDIQKYFHVPITKAAKELKVCLTILKKRCRELNIMRWPHRKIKSLKSLIDNVKELGLTNEIEMLEEHKRMLEKLPGMELSERTKKLRQACFKANYKRKRSLSALAL